MGSEILDSSGGARTIVPELLDPRSNLPVLELDELEPVTIEPPQERGRLTGPRAPLRRAVLRFRDDERARRTTMRTALLCLVVAALTASVVEFWAARAADAERAGRVAVDIRLTDVRPGASGADNGRVAADLQIHNRGPADVTVVALDVMNGGDASDVIVANDVAKDSQPVEPGLTRETAYTLALPCRPSFQLGFGPPQLVAKIRTADHALHSVPVNLDAVNEQGGLLTACVQDSGDQEPFTYGSVSDGRSVTMTIDLSSGPQMVSLVIPDVGVPVQYVTTPRLPTVARPGTTFVVKVTPRVTSCAGTPLDLDAVQNLGVSIGSQQVTDSYLPALVAQAAGRACGRG
jgi:hypothetical protein